MTRLFVSIGRNSGVRPGDLVGAFTATTGIPGKALGAIEIKKAVPMSDREPDGGGHYGDRD